MACESGMDCNLCSFLVANFADHNYIRILPQYMPQGIRKCYTYLGIYLHLIDYLQMVLYRVFHSYDIFIHGVYGVKYSVCGRCLSASGWTCKQYHAKGLLYHLFQYIQRIVKRGKLFEFKKEGALIQEAHNNLFSKHRRQSRDPYINLFIPRPSHRFPIG